MIYNTSKFQEFGCERGHHNSKHDQKTSLLPNGTLESQLPLTSLFQLHLIKCAELGCRRAMGPGDKRY